MGEVYEGIHEASGYAALVFFGLAVSVGVLIPLRVWEYAVRLHRLFVWAAMSFSVLHAATTDEVNGLVLIGVLLLGLGLVLGNLAGFWRERGKPILVLKCLLIAAAGFVIFVAHLRF